jgi:A/G-specific adenine glycosylase
MREADPVPFAPARAAPGGVARDLLAWYDRHRRRLPWRAPPGETADPYRVWLSEIMLQQTTVQAVAPYFEAFLARWPTVADLAAVDLDAVLQQWAGLGYYARARNLHRAARQVMARHDGVFPSDAAALRDLPGVGIYTAAAIGAIAFDRPEAVMDGNIERVLARLFRVAIPLPKAKTELRRLAAELTPAARPGDYAQALMDLGSSLCTPRKPACSLCPLMAGCAARAAGDAELYPVKVKKPERPTRYGVAFWAMRGDGAVLLRKRPESGLLGGMVEVPSTEFLSRPIASEAARRLAPLAAPWRPLKGLVRHTFTHFHLELAVWIAAVRLGDPKLGMWWPLDRIEEQALPSLYRKVVRLAVGAVR